jgi:hypothetical protein
MDEFTEDQIATVTRIDFGWMNEIPQKDSYTVILTHDQISELERLVRGYTEMLALYNTLNAGKQMTLDILNEVWEQIDQATRLEE